MRISRSLRVRFPLSLLALTEKQPGRKRDLQKAQMRAGRRTLMADNTSLFSPSADAAEGWLETARQDPALAGAVRHVEALLAVVVAVERVITDPAVTYSSFCDERVLGNSTPMMTERDAIRQALNG